MKTSDPTPAAIEETPASSHTPGPWHWGKDFYVKGHIRFQVVQQKIFDKWVPFGPLEDVLLCGLVFLFAIVLALALMCFVVLK